LGYNLAIGVYRLCFPPPTGNRVRSDQAQCQAECLMEDAIDNTRVDATAASFLGRPSLCDGWVPGDNSLLASASRTRTMPDGAQPPKNPQNLTSLTRHDSDIDDLCKKRVLRAKTKAILFI
jgi:hypothetical protein